MSDTPKCELCGEPMPAGEEMFKYHGYSGPCPKPPIPKKQNEFPSESKITTRCPSCGGETLFIGSGGHLICSVIGCREPSVERCVAELYNERSRLEHELAQAKEQRDYFEGAWNRAIDTGKDLLACKDADLLLEWDRAEKAEAQVARLMELLERIVHIANGMPVIEKFIDWLTRAEKELASIKEKAWTTSTSSTV